MQPELPHAHACHVCGLAWHDDMPGCQPGLALCRACEWRQADEYWSAREAAPETPHVIRCAVSAQRTFTF